MTAEDNKAVFRRFFEEVGNKGNLQLIDEIFDPNVIYQVPDSAEPMHGLEAIYQFFNTFHTAFPDLSITVEDMIAEGNKVVALITASGTHQGVLMDIAPTGNRVRWSVVHIARFANGKIVENTPIFNQLSFLQQLGVIPPPK